MHFALRTKNEGHVELSGTACISTTHLHAQNLIPLCISDIV